MNFLFSQLISTMEATVGVICLQMPNPSASICDACPPWTADRSTHEIGKISTRRSARRQNGREILPGEYGCYRSHLLALETFLADGSQYGLIIEDDVAFDENTLRRIEAIIATVPDFDLIKLTNHRTKLFIRAAKTSLGDEIGRTLLGPQGSAAAYLVTRDGARKMISQLAVMKLPWDVALERFWDSNLKFYSSRRNVLDFAPGSAVSSIVDPSGSYKAGQFPLVETAQYSELSHKGPIYCGCITFSCVHRSNAKRRSSRLVEKNSLNEVMASIAILALISAVWREIGHISLRWPPARPVRPRSLVQD